MPRPKEVLKRRAWLHRTQPFSHIVARDVFTADFYSELVAHYHEILARGLHQGPTATAGRFARSIVGYDAYGIGFNASTIGPLAFFGSLGWHDMLCGLFNVKATGHINLGAHHHAVGSASGYIHNDFNPTWFPRKDDAGIAFPDPRRCAYKTGAGPLASADKVEIVRAVAMIYFLANDHWVEGDGGETGLFDSAYTSVMAPYLRVPPENNSILLFECTPSSYHAFLHNPGRNRNSIIMWTHRLKSDAISRWPAAALEAWIT